MVIALDARRREGDGAARLGEVHGATGKTVNAKTKIVNAARAASPARAKRNVTMASSYK